MYTVFGNPKSVLTDSKVLISLVSGAVGVFVLLTVCEILTFWLINARKNDNF